MDEKKINKRQNIMLVLGVLTLIALFGGLTYAFFNYTKTGSDNVLKVGRIRFITEEQETINLTNMFPIDPTINGIMDDETKVGILEITIEGDTDYSNGIEYLISTHNAHIYTSEGKVVPIRLYISVDGLGDENSNYFTARNTKDTNMYKIMSVGQVVGDQQLVVGFIKPNTTKGTKEGVNGTITIKAYFDENDIAITDTPDENSDWQRGRTVISTSEWNALTNGNISFQIKVEANEGIWVGEPFYNVMKRSTVMDNINSTYVQNSTPGIDFSAISSDTNGKGIYTLSSTENDAYPIMYYRGDVDNNLLFGGFCWKIVRTTDTGGIKLIYNGNPVNNQCGNDRVIEKNQVLFNSLGFYNLDSESLAYYSDNYEYDSANKVFRLTGNIISSAWNEENSANLIGKYTCFGTNSEETCSKLEKVYSYISDTELYVKQVVVDSSIMLDDNDPNKDNVIYNLEVESPASVGYMYGTNYDNYESSNDEYYSIRDSYFGTSFVYENGVYKLINPIKFNPLIISTNHYSCLLTSEDGTCESIRYYYAFFIANSRIYGYYLHLNGGKSIEDALEDMFTNTHDSLAKTMIDTWYSNNMTSYTSKLEDTIYCNDRSIKSIGGFNPNGGVVAASGHELKFGFKGIKCSNKRDSFTINSEKGNGKLDYPVAMLTNEEAELAGAIYGLNNPNTSFFLYDGNGYWTMTPNMFERITYVQRVYGGVVNLYNGGNYGGTRVDHTGYMSGFRPVISLKEGTSVASGDGTPNNPFVVAD